MQNVYVVFSIYYLKRESIFSASCRFFLCIFCFIVHKEKFMVLQAPLESVVVSDFISVYSHKETFMVLQAPLDSVVVPDFFSVYS